VQIPVSSDRWGQLRAVVGELRAVVGELRQAAPRSVHLVPIGGEDRPGYGLHELHDEASARALAVPSTRNPQRSAAAARSCVRDATGCRLVFRHRHRPAEPHAPGRSQHRRPVTQARPR
jgi:hypothetical protein